jgi:uncharacterized membrane protein
MSKLYEEYNTSVIIICLCCCSDSVVLLVVFVKEIETIVVLSGSLVTCVHLFVLLYELKYRYKCTKWQHIKYIRMFTCFSTNHRFQHL